MKSNKIYSKLVHHIFTSNSCSGFPFPKRKVLFLFLLVLTLYSFGQKSKKINNDSQSEVIMIRIAEIKIDSIYVYEYLAILKEESEESLRLEPGVICIYPMYQKEDRTEIRLLEIYANKEAYESHLKTPHFKHYKKTTLNMVKSLKLVDMEAIDLETMPKIFRKLK